MSAKTASVEKSKNSKERIKTTAMRHPALYILSIFILVIIFIAFIIGPILGGNLNSIGSGLVFGSYKGKSIVYSAGSYLVRAYESEYQNVASQAQQSARELGIQDAHTAMKSAYDSTVYRFGLLDMAQEAGIAISSKELTENLANAPRFKDENGFFSSELLNRALNDDPGLSENVRVDLTITKVQDDILEGNNLSDEEIDFILDSGKQRRIFDFVSYNFDEYPETEIITYLENNTDIFRSIELSSITVDSLNEAEQLLTRLENRENSFEELASSNSIDIFAGDNGSRGLVWYYDIQRDFENEENVEALFNLAIDQTSNIIQTNSEQFVIYRADSELNQPEGDDPEVIKIVKNYVQSFERGRIADYFLQQASDFILLANEIAWVNALSDTGTTAITSSEISINYGNTPIFPTLETASSGVLSDAGTRESLFIDMFSSEPGDISEPVELRDKIIVMRYKESATKPIENGLDDSEESVGTIADATEPEALGEQRDYFQLYLPYLAQEYLVSEVRRQFSSPENLNDNFDVAFRRLFLDGPDN